MSKNKIQKLISVMLMLALAAQWIPCGAANIVPINGGHVAVPPSAPVTKTGTDFKNPSGSFSLQTMKSKIDEVIYPQKSKAEPREENPSGTCGEHVNWSLDLDSGELTISGTGAMHNFFSYTMPWEAYRSYITSITIENGVTSIGDGAFSYCSALTSIDIPDSVTSIGSMAFYDCIALTSITIGNSVTSIGGSAFNGCSALTNITIPNSVTSIGSSAFESCSALTSINVGNDNLNYKSIDGVLFDKEIKTLIQCPGAKTSVTIPNSVTSIGDSAFLGCRALTSVTIPDSVTSIGYFAFLGCRALTSITIPDLVTSIGVHAFAVCSNLTSINVGNDNLNYTSIDGVLFDKEIKTLIQCPGAKTSVTIPNSVTSIGDSAFLGCRALTSITIPDSVTSIDYSAFQICSALSNVCYLGTEDPGKTSTDVFRGCDNLANVSVTENYMDDTFCGISVSKDGCSIQQSSSSVEPSSSSSSSSLSSSSKISSSKAIDDKKYIVKIELDDGVKENEVNVNEFIQIICEKSNISTDEVSIKVETDDENNVLSILVYVNDEKTANTVAVQVNQAVQQCQNV